MTQPDIRDLLTELVDPVATPDLAGAAWELGVRHRRRVRTAVGAGVAAAVLAVAAGTAWVRDDSSGAGPTQPSPTAPSLTEGVEATFEGYQLYRAPGLNDEAGSLPAVQDVLPPAIDLGAPNPSVEAAPIDHAVAAFGIAKVSGDDLVADGVMLVTSDGELRHLDAPELEASTAGGRPHWLPFGPGSLSPDGRKLVVRQTDGLAVYDLPTQLWESYVVPVDGRTDSPDWTPDGRYVRWGNDILDPETGALTSDPMGSPVRGTTLWVDYWWGVERVIGEHHALAAAYLNEHLPLSGIGYPSPGIVVGGDVMKVLVIPDLAERFKNCCAVAGWLDDSTLVYESSSGSMNGSPTDGQTNRLLAWDINDGTVRLVSTVTGTSDMLFMGSYADLWH